MNLIVVGTNHKYSPIKIREKISFSKKRLQDALNFLKETGVLKGGVILSTCNRVEIYASTDTPEIAVKEIQSFISGFYEINEKYLDSYLYIYRDRDSIRHLFRVASGLDSLILGELQILTQVRSAMHESEESGFLGYSLGKVFDSAIKAARKIHIETKVSEGKVSVGSVAIDFIRQRIGSLSGKKILIIGVGKVTELVLKYLDKETPDVIFVSNRTFEKAQSLALEIGAKAIRFDNLKQYLKKADIVITATKSPHFIIKKEVLSTNKPLLIIDLALPRDVDPKVKDINGIELFGLEDLHIVIKKNRNRRMQEARKAEEIIEVEARKLWQKLLELEQDQVALR